jgi:hypothetical protein
MLVRILDATLDDLRAVGIRLCAADRHELAATRDPEDVEKLARDAWQSQIRKVVLAGCEPVLVFGANPNPELDATATVWGYKTERGVTVIKSVTKFIRATMIPQLRAMGIRHATCIVHPDNTASRKWLAHLDFKPRATLTGFGSHREDMILMQRDEPDALH